MPRSSCISALKGQVSIENVDANKDLSIEKYESSIKDEESS
jgi:hypothetical protein